VLGHYRWRVKSNGRTWESDFAHIFTVKDGKAATFFEITDTAAFAEAITGAAVTA
jgi:ketosteroid isomerase-like protein